MLNRFKSAMTIAMLLLTTLAWAEDIKVLIPQGAGYSGVPQFLATIEEANRIQTQYKFSSDFKVGAFESLALRDVKNSPQTTLSTVVTSHLEAADRYMINLEDYRPVFANGDACWALASTAGDESRGLASLAGPNGLKEIVVGAPALGGALHLMGLEIGKRYNIPVRFILYKTNADAVLAMMQGDTNLTLDRVSVFQGYKTKFPNVAILAVTCGQRHHDAPQIQTLKEQRFDVPPIFNVLMSSKDMDVNRRREIRKIFETASMNIGRKRLAELGDHVPAMFQNIDTDDYYKNMVKRHQDLRTKWKRAVEAARY